MAKTGQAAVGFRVHSGWAAVVAVSLEKGGLVVLSRERMHLVKIFNYTYRQPYHTAAKAALEEGRVFIAQVREDAEKLCSEGLKRIEARLREAKYTLKRCGILLAAGRALPELEKILAAHALIHRADGELFREAILHASKRQGLKVLAVKEKELLGRAAKVLRRTEAGLLRRVTELGKPFGAPWSQDEKYATLAAWLALTPRGSGKTAR